MNKTPAHAAISRRVPCYDMARAIGIMLVVLGHSLAMDTYPRALVYSFHIPLFFFISGAVMKPLPRHNRTRQRFRSTIAAESKLLSYYIFYSFSFIIFDIVVRVLNIHQMTFVNIFWDCYQTVVLYGINVLWFLITLALAKIITHIVDSYTSHYGTLFHLAISIFAYLFFATVGNIVNPLLANGISQWISYPINALLQTCTMTPFVIMGFSLRQFIPKFIHHWRRPLPLLFIINIVCCFRFGAIDYHMLRSAFPPVSLIMAVCGIFATLGIGELIAYIYPIRTIMNWYSRHSLFIMVTHEYPLIKTFIVSPLLSLFSETAANSITAQVITLLILEIPICAILMPLTDICIAYCRTQWRQLTENNGKHHASRHGVHQRIL